MIPSPGKTKESRVLILNYKSMRKNGLCGFRKEVLQKKILYLARCCFLFVLCLVAGGVVKASAQQERVSLDLKDVSVKQLFLEIQKQTNLSFIFNMEQVEDIGTLSVKAESETVESVLNRVFRETGVGFEFSGNLIIVRTGENLPEEEKSVEEIRIVGKVSDVKKQPLPGVTVQLKGTSIGTTTNNRGDYLLRLAKSEDEIVLVFSFIGMETKEVKYAGKDTINVTLKESVTQLDEVVVNTGYQQIDARKNTSAITTIRAEDIITPGLQTIDQMLEGRVPGLTFLQNTGQIGATPRLRIRGTSTILGSREPVWVVDGMIVEDPVDVDPTQLNDLDFVNLLGNAISGLNPEDIEQIDVLKDASATALYGDAAANGVIVITTKKGKQGPPQITYSLSGSFTQRPSYNDRSVRVMNSKERVAYSRELIEKRMSYPNVNTWVGYEAAYRDYMNGYISYDEFQREVDKYETINTDWFDILMQNAYSHKHTLSLSGGSSSVRYYASVGLNNVIGTVRGELNRTYTTTINLNGNFNKFSIRFGLTGNLQKKEYTPNNVGVTEFAYNTSRAIPAYDENGGYYYYNKELENSDGETYYFPVNILEDMGNTSQDIEQNGLTLQTQVSYKILKDLEAQISLGYSFSNSKEQVWYGEESSYAKNLNKSTQYADNEDLWMENTELPAGGVLEESRSDHNNYNLRATLNYSLSVDREEFHNLSAILGWELSSSKYRNSARTTRGYMKDRGESVSLFDLDDYPSYKDWLSEDTKAFGVFTNSLNNKVSAFMVLGYNYKDIYLLNFNARIDYSNKFGDQANDKFFPIWSISGRWDMTGDILRNVSWIDNLSLKASFGYQGNAPTVAPNMVIKKEAVSNWFNEEYSTVQQFPNPSLKWEKTANWNFTLDFAFLNNKINGSVTYYYRKTKDAFQNAVVSDINGVSSYQVNTGTLTNQGYELSLNFVPVNTIGVDGKGFRWRFDPQLGSVINKLIDKAIDNKDRSTRDDDELVFEDYLNGTVQTLNRNIDGFYSYRFRGLDPKDGRPIFPITATTEEEFGEEFSTMTNEERYLSQMVYSGERTPFLSGGVSNTFSWNRFSASLFLSYSIGSKIRLLRLYSNINSSNLTMAPDPMENVRSEMVNRWKNPGDEKRTNIPGILTNEEFKNTVSYNTEWWRSNAYNSSVGRKDVADHIWQMYDYSDIRVVSGDYLKISTASIRYNVPEDFCKKIGMKSAYIGFTGTNLYTFCSKKLKGQDPTQSGSTSTITQSVRPTYSLTLNITL